MRGDYSVPTVSACHNIIKSTLQQSFKDTPLIVVGEIDDFASPDNDNYMLFNITEKNTQLHKVKVYVTSQILSQISITLCNGQIVEVTGIPAIYRGELQILAKKITLVKDRLQPKMPYPYLNRPKKKLAGVISNIAVITSAHGQVHQDLISNLKYGKTEIFDTPMQGMNVATKIIEQIAYINELSLYDCICIIRGGGSNNSDFYGYNDHRLASSIQNSKIPILTAIGHDADKFLCDQVADNPEYFSTPTAIPNYLNNYHENILKEASTRISIDWFDILRTSVIAFPWKKVMMSSIILFAVYKYLIKI